ncbi:MAG: AAA family ATPase [Actinomycetota bacterium]|nr:AAA family ATPase [Actinomycetota bacterium]
MSSLTHASELLEREPDLARIDAALAEARDGGGACLLVRGTAGIGKSALLSAACERAELADMLVVRAASVALESDLSFGVCAQLFGRLAHTGDGELFSGAAAFAKPVLVSGEAMRPAIGEDRILSLVHGLYWLSANLAERAPLLVSIDDAHWADGPSLRFAHFLLRRLEGTRIALILATRPSAADGAGALIDAIAAEPRSQLVEPQDLTAEAVTSLVCEELGEPEPEFAAACVSFAGGNPLYVRELLRAAREAGVEPRAGAISELATVNPVGISHSVLARVSGASAGTLSRVVAVAGERLSLRECAVLAGLELEETRRAVDALALAGVLEAREPLRFTHPLAREAVYEAAPQAERAAIHLAVAALLRERGDGRELVASHLLKAERSHEPWVVSQLQLAAFDAVSHGSPGVGAVYLTHALELAQGDEARGPISVALGLAETEAGRPEGADRLEAAIDLLDGPVDRAGALLGLGTVLTLQARVGEATSAYEQGIAELEGAEGGLARDLEAMCAIGLSYDLRARVPALERIEALVGTPGIETSTSGRALLAQAASERAYQGGALEELKELAERAVAPGLDRDDPLTFWVYVFAAYAMNDADEYEFAERAVALAIELARERGSALQAAAAYHPRAFINYRRGRIDAALADAQVSCEGASAGWQVALPSSRAVLAEAYLERGELDAAAAALELPGGDERWARLASYTWLLGVRGRLELERGEPERALETLTACGELRDGAALTNPSVLSWRTGAAVAAHRLGRQGEALGLAREDLELARGFGAPRAMGQALRTLGLVSGGDEGLELLRKSLAVLEPSPSRLEHLRTLVELGSSLRRAGHRAEAREPLRKGLDLALRCGALALAERAETELAASGARPRRLLLTGVDALTPSERRIATMAAEGKTNPQIAQLLFLTRRTVEMHLTNAYRKLDIKSRAELPQKLGLGNPGLPEIP